MPTVTGPLLRAERRAADITVIDVASRMGLSRQAVHRLEADCEPSADRVAAYRTALEDARTAKVAARAESAA